MTLLPPPLPRLAHALGRARCAAMLGIAAGFWSVASVAAPLPEPQSLRAALAEAPAAVRVIEPHLSTRLTPVALEYRGWPAELVLDRVLGNAWRAPGVEVELRALDGYVSRIPSGRFGQYRAWFVFERVGQADFTVDNLQQNEKRVALGPWYLVWDNIRHPELIPEGGTYWPYQVTQIEASRARQDALLPAGIAPGHEVAAAQAQKYCLSCHRVNGYGGDKAPGDLARLAQVLPPADFLRWVLEPGSMRPGTTMPGLPDAMPDSERREVAQRLRQYLVAVPARP